MSIILLGQGKNAEKLKGFSILLIVLLLVINSFVSVQAVNNKSESSKASTYVLRNDNLEITDIQYTITEDNKYKITVTANCVYSQYLHYCNLLYTYEVSDATTDHLDWSDKNVELVQPTTQDGFTFVYDLVITADCVIAINLMEGSSGYVSKPVVISLSNFPTEAPSNAPTEPVTELITESSTEPNTDSVVFVDFSQFRFYFSIIIIILLIIMFLCVLRMII